MPEEISAHITIGGRIPGELVQELCASICQEGVGLDWCGQPFEPNTAQDLLDARQVDKNGVRLFADCAAWGEFEALERFLIEHQIPFDRHHDAKYEIANATLFYRPELGSLEFLTDDGEELLCRAQPLLPVQKMLTQAQAELNRGRNREAGFLVEECLQRLRDHVPPEIPPLPPFEIV